MSKFCENCGAEMDDNETVCKYCQPNANEQYATQQPITDNTDTVRNNTSSAKTNSTKNYAIIGGVAIAIVVLLIIIFGGGYKKPLDYMYKGLQKCDAEIYLKAYPEFMDLDKTINDDFLDKKLNFNEDLYGEKIKYSYKIADKSKVKKDDLKDVQEYIEKRYKEDVKISSGYKLKVKETIKGKKNDHTSTNTAYVYKIDGKWYMLEVTPSEARNYND